MAGMDSFSIICGDALKTLKGLQTEYIQTCITSPPYYGLRDYGVEGQIGLEDTPEEYIDKLVEVFREVRRVLRPDGTLWVNIADSYAGSGKGAWQNKDAQKETYIPDPGSKVTRVPKTFEGIKPKDIIGIPWMLAFALRKDGWYLRQDIIWNKPNCIPEGVEDRCTKSHEYLFLLSKSPRYYFDFEAIKEPVVDHKASPDNFGQITMFSKNKSTNFPAEGAQMRRKRSVWEVPVQPYRAGKHIATFPEELVRPCILAGSRPGNVVLDPFAGSATTGAVAIKEDRFFLGIELNPDYAILAQERLEAI